MTLGLDEQKKRKKKRLHRRGATDEPGGEGGSVVLKSGAGHSGLRQQSPGGWKQSLGTERVGGQVSKVVRGLAENGVPSKAVDSSSVFYALGGLCSSYREETGAQTCDRRDLLRSIHPASTRPDLTPGALPAPVVLCS